MSKLGDLMQNFMMANPKRANWFLTRMPERVWQKIGAKKALEVFHETAEKVPAYKDFLKKNKTDPAKIKTIEDFKQVPIMDKENYIKQYKLEDLCLDGSLAQMYNIARSSGATGKPLYWPRLKTQDEMLPKVLDLSYTYLYNVDKIPTLLLVTFALGTWLAGELAAEVSRRIAKRQGYPLSIMTPGIDLEQTLEIINDFSSKYEQILIFGYPPFLKDVIDHGEEQGIDWRRLNVRLMTGGEGFSEQWRSHLLEKIGKEDDLTGIISFFGTADGGFINHETPFTVLLRQLVDNDKKLAKDLFGVSSTPALIPYNPAAHFLEDIDGELTMTVKTGLPLVRYCIRDIGKTVSIERALTACKEHGYELLNELGARGYESFWNFPIFYAFGRSDMSVTVYGANVYLEQLKAVFDDRIFQETCTGKFLFGTSYTENQDEFLSVHLELKPRIKPSDKLTVKLCGEMENILCGLNTEFTSSLKAAHALGKTILKVNLYPAKHKKFGIKDAKLKYLETA